ncbi:hypothetical protein ACFLU6_05995 [Acidobacteriota bacterium]
MKSIFVGAFLETRVIWFAILALGLAMAAFGEEIGSGDTAGQPNVIDNILAEDEALVSGMGTNYDSTDRRDPFVNPMTRLRSPDVGTGDDGEIQCDGIECMMIDEVSLMGLAEMGDEPIAIFMGTDNKGYFIRIGDSLWDGKVAAIDLETGVVTFQQKIEDPTSAKRSREVLKKLHPEASGP